MWTARTEHHETGARDRSPGPPAHFDLEDPRDLARLAEPMTALAPLRGVVVIDEIRRRPDLFPVLRVLADRRPIPARLPGALRSGQLRLAPTVHPDLSRARSSSAGDHHSGRYLDVLTGLFMVRQLQPWHENLKKRQVKSPKVFLRDSGLLHALLGLASDRF